MSKMKELYQKVAGDSALQAKFANIVKEAEAAKASTQEKLVAFAKEAGYEISLEEAQGYFKSLSDREAGELTSTELDMVAGGKNYKSWIIDIAASTFSMGFRC